MKKFKLWDKIRLAFYYLIQGMISADKVIASGTGDDSVPVGGIEQQQEQQSVYKDLLKGEVTQEVKELRHQMYFVERKSKEYEYGGGGHAVKKNNMFGYTGNIEDSDGHKIKLVQENKELVKGLDDAGIHLVKGDVVIDDKLQSPFKTSDGINAEYRIHCDRNFFPRYRIERYTTKVVVKSLDDPEHVLVDFYIPQYRQQFNNISKLFQAELDRIYQGDKRSDLVQFDCVWFKTKDCYGSDDMITFKFDQPRFDDIIKFDGSYVLRFYCHVLVNGEDEAKQFFNQEMAEKYAKKERREGATIDLEAASYIMKKENLDMSEDIDLLKGLRNKETAE